MLAYALGLVNAHTHKTNDIQQKLEWAPRTGRAFNIILQHYFEICVFNYIEIHIFHKHAYFSRNTHILHKTCVFLEKYADSENLTSSDHHLAGEAGARAHARAPLARARARTDPPKSCVTEMFFVATTFLVSTHVLRTQHGAPLRGASLKFLASPR